MSTQNRRYDLDWIRVFAIVMLLVYHVAISFQRWGIMIGFIANENSWDSLWIPMTMLNVWRIPLLFFVSGMGVYFAIQNRNWKQLLQERATRILIPFLFGMIFIFPASKYIWQKYYQWTPTYTPEPGHLWFLGNIFAYVLILCPVFFYLKGNEHGKVVAMIKKILGNPFGLLVVIAASVAEVILVNPNPYELYAMRWHGFFLGLLAFFFGFCFVLSGDKFWNMLLRWRWMFLLFAISLYVYRLFQFQMRVPTYLLAIESDFWIFSVFAFGYRYLNHPGKALTYLSQSVLPVYIVHMIFLFVGCWLIFPLNIDVRIQFVLVLSFTLAGCFGAYELIRRITIIKPLFGLKIKRETSAVASKENTLLI